MTLTNSIIHYEDASSVSLILFENLGMVSPNQFSTLLEFEDDINKDFLELNHVLMHPTNPLVSRPMLSLSYLLLKALMSSHP